MSKTSKKKMKSQSEETPKKKKISLYFVIGIGLLLFFTLIYPSFTPILTKYTAVKHITEKGRNIKDFELSEVSFSDEKNFYIITITDKKNGKKRELGISSKFFPTTVEYDVEP